MNGAQALARNSDPHTSHAAAREAERSGRAERQRQIVLRCVKRHAADRPRTSMELAACMRLDRYMVARRLPELEKARQVRKSGSRTCEVSGRTAIVWAPVQEPGQGRLF